MCLSRYSKGMATMHKIVAILLTSIIAIGIATTLSAKKAPVQMPPKLSQSQQPQQQSQQPQQPQATAEMINYLTGRFNPAKHPAFIKVPARYANRSGFYLRKEAFAAYKKMHQAARKDGVKLVIRSATRNFDYQKGIWERKWRKQSKGKQSKSRRPIDKALNILKLSSMPSTSRHHWGTEVDLNAFTNRWFEHDKGLKLFQWLNNNAAKFGFHRPYTQKNAARPTGYNEEKWHWSYTPLSIPMLRDAKMALDDTKITGFSGSEVATQIGVVKNYILGVSESCQ